MASSPQAWVAASSALFGRTLLGIEPEMARTTISADPIVPSDFANEISLFGLRAFGKKFNITLEGGNKARVEQEVERLPHPSLET